jgi:hypothetical protein
MIGLLAGGAHWNPAVGRSVVAVVGDGPVKTAKIALLFVGVVLCAVPVSAVADARVRRRTSLTR